MESGSLKLANFAILSPARFPIRFRPAASATGDGREADTANAISHYRCLGYAPAQRTGDRFSSKIIPKPTMPARREWKEERMGEEVGE